MPLIKMAAAARRAHMGSLNAARRALRAAGIPIVTISPGEYAVEEADLERFLQSPRSEALVPTRKRAKTPKKDRRR
jgi:hypothetical protein